MNERKNFTLETLLIYAVCIYRPTCSYICIGLYMNMYNMHIVYMYSVNFTPHDFGDNTCMTMINGAEER